MADDKLSKKEIKFWRSEMKMLDTLYADRMKEWSRLSESYDLKFKQRIRDLDPDDIVEVSTFIEEVRGIIGNVAKNHPRQLFHVDDDESGKAGDTLEAASAAYFELTHIKPHMHQAIFDALFCGVGWIRVDYNPAGDVCGQRCDGRGLRSTLKSRPGLRTRRSYVLTAYARARSVYPREAMDAAGVSFGRRRDR